MLLKAFFLIQIHRNITINNKEYKFKKSIQYDT